MDPQLESRPAFLFFKGAANGLFAEGADRLTKGVNDQQALLIGIRCERGSHRFFKKYGERFEDSEGKQIFMEFAEEEKQHLELLDPRIQESRHAGRGAGRPAAAREAAVAPTTPAPVELSASSIFTFIRPRPTASAIRPMLVDLAWRAGIRTMSVTDHDTVAALTEAETRRNGLRHRVRPRHRDHGRARRARRPRARLFHRSQQDAALDTFLEQQRADRVRRVAAIADRLAELGKPIDSGKLLAPRPRGKSLGRPDRRQGAGQGGACRRTRGRRSISLIGEGKPAFVSRCGPAPADVIDIISRAGGIASLAHPGLLKRDDLIPGMVDAGLTAVEAFHSEHDACHDRALPRAWPSGTACS